MVHRYDQEGEPSQLVAVDIFVNTVDPLKEHPLVIARTDNLTRDTRTRYEYDT